jgi:hypothetical protein
MRLKLVDQDAAWEWVEQNDPYILSKKDCEWQCDYVRTALLRRSATGEMLPGVEVETNVDVTPEVFAALYRANIPTYTVHSPIFGVMGNLAGAPLDDPVAKKAERKHFASVQDMVLWARQYAKGIWLYRATENESLREGRVNEGIVVRWWVMER